MTFEGFTRSIIGDWKTLSPIILLLALSSMVVGVQRVFLSIYTSSFESRMTGIVIGAAISLGSYGFSKAIGNYLAGQLSSRFSRKSAQIVGIFVLILGSLILILTNTLIVFFLGNSCVGLGIGLIYASSTISMTDITKPQDRGKTIALMELSVYLSTSFGGFMSGIFSNNQPRQAFSFAFAITCINLLLIYFIRNTSEKEGSPPLPKFNLNNRLIEISNHQKISEEVKQVIFSPINERIRLELEKPRSVRLRERLYSPSLLVIFSTGIITRIADSVMIVVFPLLLLSYNFSIIQVAFLSSLFTICWAIGIALSGQISDNIGRKRPMILGEFTEATGYMMMFFLGVNGWLPILIIGTVISGLGRGLYFPLSASAATEFVSPEQRARTLGIYRFILDSGYVVGAALVIILVDFRTSTGNQFEPIFNFLISLLFILAVISILYLKESKPGFKQLPTVSEHLNEIAKTIECTSRSVELFNDDEEKSAQFLTKAKEHEQQADAILERLTKDTFQHVWKTSYDLELLQFATKVDKVAGHSIRGVRKLHSLTEPLPPSIILPLEYYGRLLNLLVDDSVETVSLMSVRIDQAAEYSYTVSAMEEVLDNLHKYLWRTITDESTYFQPIDLILVTQAIDSLEKAANVMEDSIEIIRLLAFKHRIYYQS